MGGGGGTALFCVPYSLHNKLPFFFKVNPIFETFKKVQFGGKKEVAPKTRRILGIKIGLEYLISRVTHSKLHPYILICKKTHQLRTFAAKEPMIKC